MESVLSKNLSRRKCLTYRFRADNRPDFLVPYHGIREINFLHLLSSEHGNDASPSTRYDAARPP
jgi:hypothetical protein